MCVSGRELKGSTIINTSECIHLQHYGDFPDDIFKCIFWNKGVWTWIKFSLNFVINGPLVQIVAWRRSDDKPLSEPDDGCSTDAYMRHSASMKLTRRSAFFSSIWRKRFNIINFFRIRKSIQMCDKIHRLPKINILFLTKIDMRCFYAPKRVLWI